MISARFALLVAQRHTRSGSLLPVEVKPTRPAHSIRNGEAHAVLGKLVGLWRPFNNSLKERMKVSYPNLIPCALAHDET